MTQQSISPKVKNLKKAISKLNITCNTLRSYISFKKLSSWSELAAHVELKYIPKEVPFNIVSFNEWFYKPSLAKIYFDSIEGVEITPAWNEADALIESNLELSQELVPFQQAESEAETEEIPRSPLQSCYLLAHQKKAVKKLVDKILSGKQGLFLQAQGGAGKTFIVGQLFRYLKDSEYVVGKCATAFPFVYVTKASVVKQCKRVFEDQFGFALGEVLVINYDALRSKFGKLFLRESRVVINNVPQTIFKWSEFVHPLIIVWDEGQSLKNTDSIQSQIGQAFSDLTSDKTVQIFSSATLFTRVSESKCFAVATKHKFLGKPLNNITWPVFAKHVASPAEPEDYCEASVERLMDELDDYVVDVTNVRPQFGCSNATVSIEFQDEKAAKAYDSSIERYFERRNKIESSDMGNKAIHILTEQLILQMSTELIRSEPLADMSFNNVSRGFAAVVGCKFKHTIAKIVSILVNKHGVPRSKISLIWGGSGAFNRENKTVFNPEEINSFLQELARNNELDPRKLKAITEQLELQAAGLNEMDPSLDLGVQNKEQRQEEIDRFQRGESLYCIFSYKAGGVGLSLHHSDELTKFKCRRKPSGYVVEEDIPLVPVRQRRTLLTPTYSAIELVQSLCRVPRVTSLSHTNQMIIFYKNTIETRIQAIANAKLKCLRAVVRKREHWQDVIWESRGSGSIAVEDMKIEDDNIIDVGGDENEM